MLLSRRLVLLSELGLGRGGKRLRTSLLLLLQLLGLLHEEEGLLQGHDHLLPLALAQASQRGNACCSCRAGNTWQSCTCSNQLNQEGLLAAREKHKVAGPGAHTPPGFMWLEEECCHETCCKAGQDRSPPALRRRC